MLGRASLIIGVFKGCVSMEYAYVSITKHPFDNSLDVSEDFQAVRDEILAGNGKRSFRGSRIRPLMISEPRFSTFRQLSPEATQVAFNAFREKQQQQQSQLRPLSLSSRPTPGSRVTVHFDASSGRAPTLQMRFSGFDMPSPAEIVESVESRPASEWVSSAPSRGSYYANSTMTRHTIALPDMPPPPPSAFFEAQQAAEANRIVVPNVFAHSRDISNMSNNSGFQDSVNSMYFTVTDLTSQFPRLPLAARATTNASQQARLQSMRNSFALQNTLAMVPESSPGTESYGRNGSVVLTPAPIDPFNDDETQTGVTIPAPLRNSEHIRQMSIALSAGLSSAITTGITTDSSLFTRPQVSPQPTSTSSFATPTTAQTEDPFKYDNPGVVGRASVVPPLPPVQEYGEGGESPTSMYSTHDRGKSMETLDISWLTRPGPSERLTYDDDEIEEFTVERAMRKRISSSPRRPRSAARIKSIGKAPRRYTPSPTTATSYTRDSVYIEPIAIPPKQLYGFPNVELEQGSLNGSMMSGPLRDSEVFGRYGGNESFR